jgi:hypothetical protein
LLLQGIRNFFRHVAFVVLGKHVVGLEDAGAVERPFCHNTLPLAEQVRQNALISDRYGAVSVRHLEAHRKRIAAGQAAGSDEPAEANACAGSDMSVGELKKTMESFIANNTRRTATASTLTPPAIMANRRCLRVIALS